MCVWGGGGVRTVVTIELQAMQGATGTAFDFSLYSTCEKNAKCREVLAGHKKCATHSFMDLTDWLPQVLNDEIATMQYEAWCDYENQLAFLGKSSDIRLCSELGEAFLRRAHQHIRDHVRCSNTDLLAPCERHGSSCPLVPDLQDGLESVGVKKKIWIEIAGNSCAPWSAAGTQKGWLDAASLPAVAWGALIGKAQPHIIVNECTPRWKGESFFRLCLPPEYLCCHELVCPTHMGIPCRRLRSYWICSRLAKQGSPDSTVRLSPAMVTAMYAEACKRSLDIYADVFFAAPQEEVLAYQQALLSARQLQPPEDESLDWKALVSFAARRRLQDRLSLS